MDINIVGIEVADLSSFIYNDKYKNGFFIYCDVEEYCYSCDDENGFKKIRRFNNYWYRRCIGIPVCSRKYGCYNGLNTFVRQLIDNSFKTAVEEIEKHGFDTLYYSIPFQKGDYKDEILIYDEHPFVDASITRYIMNKIRSLSNKNIKIMFKRLRSNTI
jgi:hypothetical protein